MSSRLRALVTCLLAAALPLQGIAAATMAGCGPTGEHPSHHHPAATQAVALAATSVHHHHDGHHADHPPAAEPEPHAVDAHADASPSASPAAASDAKCSACAACCLATALPLRLPAFELSPPTHAFAPIGPAPAPVFLTSGLERPPRSTTDPHRLAR